MAVLPVFGSDFGKASSHRSYLWFLYSKATSTFMKHTTAAVGTTLDTFLGWPVSSAVVVDGRLGGIELPASALVRTFLEDGA